MSDREMGEIKVMLSEHVREQREFNSRIEHFIYGNGKPGANVRLDRLEQSAHRGRWWLRILAVPVVGLVVGKVFASLGGG